MQGVPNRGGAEEARGTHNPEVIGSNPISGIYSSHRNGASRHSGKLVSGVAQTVSALGDGSKPITRGRGIETLRRTLFLRLCFTEAGRLDADVKCTLITSSWTLNAASFTGVA